MVLAFAYGCMGAGCWDLTGYLALVSAITQHRSSQLRCKLRGIHAHSSQKKHTEVYLLDGAKIKLGFGTKPGGPGTYLARLQICISAPKAIVLHNPLIVV